MVTSPVLVVVTMTVVCCYVAAVSNNNTMDIAPRSIGGVIYKIFTTTQLNFYEGQNYCRAEGMELASIESAEDQQILEAVMKNTGLPQINVWTSGNDLAQYGRYVWASNGYPFTYTNFFWGEPDHKMAGEIEHCVRVESQIGFKWNDWFCSRPSYVACQVKHTVKSRHHY